MSKTAQWSTEYDTANKVITHRFRNDVSVVNSLNFKNIKLFKGDRKINEVDYSEDCTIKSYMEYLLDIEKLADSLV